MQNEEGLRNTCRGLAPSLRGRLLLSLFLCSAFCILTSAFAAEPSDPLPNFVRFEDDGHGGGKMQAAVGHYVNDDGIEVDLLSTMHIGEQGFFRDLAKQFPKYDAVLYELVAHRGEDATEEGVNPQQKQIARDCDLENQGPHMNYDRKNFVHADLDLEEIQKLEVAKHGTFKGALGEGPGIKSAKDENDTAGQSDVLADIQAAKKAPAAEKIRLMRRAYSKILAVTAEPAAGETYPAGMDVLVGARNDRVMKVLAAQMGKGNQKIAIFYGAAHMVDLEHRLFVLGFKRQSVTWQTAWTVGPDGSTSKPALHAKP